MVQVSSPKDTQVAQALHSRVLGLKAELSRNAFAFGEALVEMRDREHYRLLGFPTFEDYLVSPEVAVARRTAYSFMRIYQRFGHVHHDAHALDWNKLDILASIIKEGEAPERILPLLEDAAGMTRPELRAAVKAAKQGKLETPPERLTVPPPEVQHVGHGSEPIEANYTAAPITAADLLAPVAPAPPLPQSPAIVSIPASPRADDDDDLSVREYAIMTNYTHLVEDLLRVAHKHRQTIAEIPPRDVQPLRTAADHDREASLRPLFDWFAFGGDDFQQPLRRVK
jgi:hypothetical protein